MTKHVIDQPRETRADRLARFARLAEREGLRDGTRKLMAQERLRAGQRIAAFARIARGRTV